MNRLLKIEWCKLKYHAPFWVFAGLHVLILLMVFLSGKLLLDFLSFKGEALDTIADPSKLPVYSFPDVWHNLSYVASVLKFIPAFYVIIAITNEISFGTLRQNIMNGLSRNEFLASQLVLLLILSLTSTLFLLVAGLILGFTYTSPVELRDIVKYSGFLPAYFLEVNCYMLLALLIGLWLKRTGVAMLILLLYTFIVEPLLLMRIKPEWIRDLFPVRSINNLVHFPFGKYLFRETQDYVTMQDAGMALVYLFLFLFLISAVLKKRDL